MRTDFIHTADIHIFDKHIYSVNNSRLLQIKNNLKLIVNYAVANKIKLIVISGDLIDVYNPNENTMKVFSWFITLCYSNEIAVRAITGDHDTNGVNYSVDSVKNLLKHFKNKELIKIYTNGTVTEKINGTNFVFIPFQSDLKKAIVKANNLIVENEKNVLVTHAGVNKDVASSGFRVESQIKSIDFKNWDYVALGDFHAYQHIGYNAYYSGSIIRINAGERNDKKCFLHVNDFKPNRVPLPDIAMINVEIDHDDIIKYTVGLQIKNKLVAGAIIFIKVYGLNNSGYNLSSLSSKFYSAGASQVYMDIIKRKFVQRNNEDEDDTEIIEVSDATKDYYNKNRGKHSSENELTIGLNYIKE